MPIKFEKKFWVLIKKCDSETAWYKDSVGTLQYVTDELSNGDNIRYTLIHEPAQSCRERGIYSFIEQADAEIITPTLLQKIAHWLNIESEKQTA